MTINGVVVAGGGVLALAAWLRYGYPPALALAVLCGALLLVGLPAHLCRWRSLRVYVDCPVPFAERGASVAFRLAATGRGTAELTIDGVPGVTSVGVGRPLRWSSPPLPRGRLTVAVSRMSDVDVLGLWRRRLRFAGGRTEVVVLPRYVELAPPPDTLDHEQDGRPAPLGTGEGTTFAGLREYEPGDDIRHIDWSASARGTDDNLYVRQFAPALVEDLLVVLDPYLSATDSRADFETAVDLAYSFVRAGADLWVAGEQQPYCGRREAEEALLTLVPSDDPRLPAGALPSAATTVITAAGDRATDLLRACGISGRLFRCTGEPGVDDGVSTPVADLADAQAAWDRGVHA